VSEREPVRNSADNNQKNEVISIQIDENEDQENGKDYYNTNTDNNNKLNKQTKLKDLLIALNNPELYIIQYFDEIKNEVDLFFTKNINDQTDENQSTVLNDNWLEIIETIKNLESEILEKKNYLKINDTISAEIKLSIRSFENRLNSLNSDAKEKQIEVINKEIEEHIEKIEKILFENKSLYFKNDNKSPYLIVIDDAFLNKDLEKNDKAGTFISTKKKLNHLLFKSKLLVTKKTNVTTLKIKDLKKLTID